MKPAASLVALASVAALTYGGSQAWKSPAFRLEKVEVIGNAGGEVTSAQLISAGRLVKGQHLLKVSTGRAEREITAIAWVKSARVERILPSKIRITIRERHPVFVAVVSGKPYLVDSQAIVLAQAERPLVRVLNLPAARVIPGEPLKLIEFRHASMVLSSLPAQVREQVVSVDAASIDGIRLHLSEGGSILYGAAEQGKDKNFAIEALLEKYREEGKAIDTIDVRVPLRPSVKLR